MRYLLFPGLSLLFLFCLGSNQLFAGSHSVLPLSKADSIRVLLFSDSPTNNIKIKGFDGSITVFGDEFKIEADTSEWIQISTTKWGILIKKSDRTYYSRSIEIKTDPVSLINLIHEDKGYRYYRGRISIVLKDKFLHLLNTVNLEDYVSSVVGSEMNFEHLEALKTQSVISRTYALWNVATRGTSDYDLTDHTMSQVYEGELIKKPYYREATLATSGEVITWSNQIILAVFFSTCGGHTTNNETVWSGNPLPYLRSITDDDACKQSPHFKWEYHTDKKSILLALNTYFNDKFTDFIINEQPEPRANTFTLTLANGKNRTIKSNEFRLAVIQSAGIRSLKSTNFLMKMDNKSIIFKGNGMGHGTGLCQWGTLGLAQSGWNYKTILKFYYKGTEILDLHAWPEETIKLATS